MLTIVWDVDDVLNDLMFQWFTHGWKREHPECRFSFTELVRNPPHEILGIALADYLASMDRFRESEGASKLIPNPAVLAWFKDQGQCFRHIALTARPLESAPDLAHWVLSHFGDWIRCFGVVPSRSVIGVPVYDRSKEQFLTWLGRGDVLVDDSPENIRQAASLGMRTLLVAQPWNNSTLTTKTMLRQLSELAGE